MYKSVLKVYSILGFPFFQKVSFFLLFKPNLERNPTSCCGDLIHAVHMPSGYVQCEHCTYHYNHDEK